MYLSKVGFDKIYHSTNQVSVIIMPSIYCMIIDRKLSDIFLSIIMNSK